MKTVFLFPHRFKTMGWIVLVPSLILGLSTMLFSSFELDALDWKVPWNGNDSDNFTNELLMILVLVSAMVVGFSKTKEEDEYVQKIRLDSLVWSIYLNYTVLFLGIIGVYEFEFFNVLVINMYTPLLIFIVRFHYYYLKR